MSDCVDRIAAQEDGRKLTIAGMAQSGETFTELHQRLVRETGSIMVVDEVAHAMSQELDKAGLDELRKW